jgi:hypothetical protein
VRNRRSLLSGAGRWCTSFTAVLCFATSIAVAQSTLDDIPERFLTNQDVIETLGSGMTPLAVISRIHNSPCKFDKPAAGLEALRAANVPYHVVLAMMKAPENACYAPWNRRARTVLFRPAAIAKTPAHAYDREIYKARHRSKISSPNSNNSAPSPLVKTKPPVTVLVQPEMESWGSLLASIPPF